MTPLQPEASAKAPCTRTTVMSLAVVGRDTCAPRMRLGDGNRAPRCCGRSCRAADGELRTQTHPHPSRRSSPGADESPLGLASAPKGMGRVQDSDMRLLEQ